MKLEGLLFRVTLGILTEEEKEMVKNIMEDVLALRAEKQSIDPDIAHVSDYERVLIKMGELILNDIT